MKISEIIKSFEEFAPLSFQESYDNSGLNIGNPDNEITGILLCIDVTLEIIEEAISKSCNLIISHHPLIFPNLKKITGANFVEKSAILAIKNDISIYCAHTNFDSATNGVSHKLCEKLHLTNTRVMLPKNDLLKKIVVYVPTKHADNLRNSMFEAGAGEIGKYSSCSFNSHGHGSFMAGENCKPFVGEKDVLHFEDELRIEMTYPSHLENKIIQAMHNNHPYEEIAYDIYSIANKFESVGLGMIGDMQDETSEIDFLDNLKNIFNLKALKHSKLIGQKIRKVAVCGGSGSFLIERAKQMKAQILITSDIKYHDYFLAENKLLLVDIGHFESEQFTKEIFYDIIKKKNPKFAVHFSEINTNPIKIY